MIDPKIQDELLDQLNRLPNEAQRQVADFARALAAQQSSRTTSKGLLQLAGTVDPEDLRVMEQAIEEGCEQVDVNGW